MAARVGTVHQRIEQWAWTDFWKSSRHFFTFVALVLFLSIFVVTLATAGVARRNGNAVEHARDQQRVATSLTEFRRHLSTADAQVAIITAAEDHDLPLRQTSYEDAVLQANRWLTEAGLVATGQSVHDIEELAQGLVRYGRLVQTARAYPPNSTFASLASAKSDCLAHDKEDHPDCSREDDTSAPTADSVRETAEESLRMTAADGADGLSMVVIAGLLLAGVVLLGGVLLVAGRTRRWLHWSFALSGVLLLVELVLAAPGLWSQQGELTTVVGAESGAYAAANKANLDLLDLRATELKAVTSDDATGPDGRITLHERFRQQAEELLDHLDEHRPEDNGQDGGTPSPLSAAVRAYESAVDDELTNLEGSTEESRADDDTGDEDTEGSEDEEAEDEAWAQLLDTSSLTGGSASSYRLAHEIANSVTVITTNRLTERLDAAEEARVGPWTPLIPGVAAAFLAGAGVLHRGRTYWRGQ